MECSACRDLPVPSTASHSGQSRYQGIYVLVCLLVLICGAIQWVYSPVLSAKATCFDDEQYITRNLLVQNPSWSSAWQFLREVRYPSTVGGYYQPLTMISLMIDYRLGGRHDNLRPFHRTSMVLHICNTALMGALIYLLFGETWIAAAVALIFGLHPMTVETVAWASERKTLLATFFGLWSLILYVEFARKARRGLHIGCLAVYLLALLSKPTTVPLPLLMLLLDWWPLQRISWRSLVEKSSGLALATVFAVITYVSQANTAVALLPHRFGPTRVPLIVCHSVVFYLYKMVWPVNLTSHYEAPYPLTLGNPPILHGVVGTSILIILLLISLRGTRALLVGFLFFFIAILPTMQVITFTNVLTSDKYAYLPSVGILMILAWLLKSFAVLGTWRIPRLPAAAAIPIIAVAAAEAHGTRQYLACWQTTRTLFEHMLTITPRAIPVYNNLGNALIAENRLEEAIAVYRRGLDLDPRAQSLHYNLGLALAKNGEFRDAIQHLRAAIGPDRQSLPALVQLAWLLATHPDPDIRDSNQALPLAQRAAYLTHHNSSGVLDVLAAVWAEQGHFERAVLLANKAAIVAEKAHQKEVIGPIRKRLLLYQQNQPYRENPAQLWSEHMASLVAPESDSAGDHFQEEQR